ncbi:LexA family transcriptional regulator [Pseudomonas sp. TTU2014-080ASC]|uniref:LexA family transcriptional regulator n=1 Tax=Pseudomonas sp. TTU2014-080ASC TaxID=1729724 RepID=UPI0007183B27|nr:helix-turn-helix transcriptional regulator [Pseudomonas sp. TTU2014-080ASC]KRW62357.1 hypothetical protein AO726_02740 [Pseudomonas sp. TTU2014-080ASC]
MSYAKRLKAARKHAKLTQGELAKKVGITQTSISDLETEKSASSSFNASIAMHCGVSAIWLETGIGEMTNLHSPPAQQAVNGNVEGEPVPIKEGIVPVVGMAQLGSNGYFEALDFPVGHGDGYVQIYSNDPNAYALKVVGDSMEPRIRSGEYVLIEPNKGYVAGDEVLVKTLDGQSMIKVFMYCRDGEVRLLSVNEAHAPITMLLSQIDRIHVVGAIVKASRYVSI